MMEGKKITREEVNQLDLGSYEGKIVVISDPEKLDDTLAEIRQHAIVGFDTETKPAFRKGEKNQVALIQVAIPQKVYLIRICLTGISQTIVDFLEDESVKKVGIGLRDDLLALQYRQSFEPSGFVELTGITREAGIVNEGARTLTALLLGFRISKSAQTSNWENETLTEKQIRYAATDAWVCLEMYQKLEAQGYV